MALRVTTVRTFIPRTTTKKLAISRKGRRRGTYSLARANPCPWLAGAAMTRNTTPLSHSNRGLPYRGASRSTFTLRTVRIVHSSSNPRANTREPRRHTLRSPTCLLSLLP